ncbi:hypothetical protein [Pandoraea sputorum]|uniref:hypothetical protein n=1 Tax=Pandoraea sputorum TaxID=93222 RepID=UPI001240EBCD|nr:hypothetical protein [Pandoraea sputorum]VVE56639.1 hypothetical protein PSP20601_05089 [Pandoraea sputorum]
MRKFLLAISNWNFSVDFPIATRCPCCDESNILLLSELSARRHEQWRCAHCGETYAPSSQELDHAITAMFSTLFGT